MTNLIKVYQSKEAIRLMGKQHLVFRNHLDDGKYRDVEFNISSTLNGTSILIETDGDILGLNLEEFIQEIITNKDKYISHHIENLRKLHNIKEIYECQYCGKRKNVNYYQHIDPMFHIECEECDSSYEHIGSTKPKVIE